MDNIGRRVRVSLNSGEKVEGWVYAESPLAIYVALNKNGQDIRYIPTASWNGITYPQSNDSPIAFETSGDSQAIKQLERNLAPVFDVAIGRVDQNRMTRLGRRFAEHYQQLKFRQQHWLPFYEPLQTDMLPVLQTTIAHEELLDELDRAGVSELLMKHQSEIRSVVSRATLPVIDGYVHTIVHEDNPELTLDLQIRLAKENDNLTDCNLGRQFLTKIEPSAVLEIEREASRDRERAHMTKGDADSVRANRLRKIAAGMKIAVGSGLTVANIALGCLAGAVTALPTLGLGTVGAAVGIVTSAYTGLNTASDGLKNLADAIAPSQKDRG